MEKKMVWKELKTLSEYDFEGTVDAAIEMLTKYKTEYPGKTLRLEVESNHYEEGNHMELQEQRLETDEECKAREEEEAHTNARRDKYDREKYEELKKRFEGPKCLVCLDQTEGCVHCSSE